jgi:hypothetical protein
MTSSTGKFVAAAAALVACVLGGASASATPYNDAVLADNPLLYWTFDEAGDTDGAKSSVNDTADNELTPQGAASRAASTSTAGGVSLGRAALFTGTAGDMYSAPDLFGDPTPGLNNSSPGFDFIASQLWAIEFWFNASSARPNQYFSEAYDGAGGHNNPGLIYNFNAGQVEMFTGGRTGVVVSPDVWHHVVFAFYGNSGGFMDNLREIYIDGALAVSDTTSTFSAGGGLQTIALGNAVNGTVPVDGMMDEYAIYEIGNLPDLAARQAHVANIAAHYSVPEPSAAVLVMLATAGVFGIRRRRA